MRALPPLPDGCFVAGVAPSVPTWLASAWGAAGTDPAAGSVLPDSALVLVGSDARAWEAFVGDLAGDPAGLTRERNPFDAWVRRSLLAAGWGIYPHAWCDGASPLDFVAIAGVCGCQTRGLHGLLLDPERGPWWAIRGVFVVAAGVVDAVGSGGGAADPCGACIAAHAGASPPCAAACPGRVIARHHVTAAGGRAGWAIDGRACARFHVTDSACASGCAARVACPLGARWRYPPEAIAYHANRPLGRSALRARLGIPAAADPFEGEGPDWAAWAGG